MKRKMAMRKVQIFTFGGADRLVVNDVVKAKLLLDHLALVGPAAAPNHRAPRDVLCELPNKRAHGPSSARHPQHLFLFLVRAEHPEQAAVPAALWVRG